MDELLQCFGTDEYNARLERIRAFWSGNERFMVSVNASAHPYRQIFDPAIILEKAGLNLEAQASLPGVNMPAFFADFGTVSTAKYWGGAPRFDSTGGNIFLDPVADSASEALAITPLPIGHPDMDADRAVQLYKAMCKNLNTQSLWLRMPDFQGPLNTAAMVVRQEEFLVEMYTNPDGVHELLAKITDLLVQYARYCHDNTQKRVCGFVWPYTFFPCDLGLALTEDMMPLLSPELYQQFGIPCIEKLSREFGGLQIHCCGDWGRHAPALQQCRANIMAMEFHYPFTRMNEIECLAPHTVLIPYISLDKQEDFASVTDYYEFLLASTDATHRFWFAFPEDSDEAIAFAKRHGF
ncbi:MAG: hypothetical protein HQ523_07180 [Lentisphaerae bacterium]|nr:hypothetical protein [Lentisphaerota bacterium]